jgi:hypothetical protein
VRHRIIALARIIFFGTVALVATSLFFTFWTALFRLSAQAKDHFNVP